MRRCRILLLLLPLLIAAVVTPAARGSTTAQPRPEVTFNLIVSLEWQPGRQDSLLDDLELAGCPMSTAKDLFIEDLKEGLRRSAAYLYYSSEGQMAFADIKIYSDGQHWEDADVRILANSDYRPTAFVGGIVTTPTLSLSLAPSSSPTIFAPAAIYLSRLWDGDRSRCGPWSAAEGWRTISHEWGHHALYLYDEYFNVETGIEQYCTTTGLSLGQAEPTLGNLRDSLMAYHYTADKFWLSGSAPSGTSQPWSCQKTPQTAMHSATDWQTIATIYGLPMPTALRSDLTFAGSPAEAMLNIQYSPPSTPLADTSAVARLASQPHKGMEAQAYLIRPDDRGRPQRIIGQGMLLTGGKQLPFWGVKPSKGDRASLHIQNVAGGTRYAYPPLAGGGAKLDVSAHNPLTATKTAWQPFMTVKPLVFSNGTSSEVGGLHVSLTDCAGLTEEVEFTYCPAGGNCEKTAIATATGSSSFEHIFRFPRDGVDEPPALHGYIYARSRKKSPGREEETVAWYQLAGGVGPAHTDGHAPLLDGPVQVDIPPNQASVSGHNRVAFNPTRTCSATSALPPDVLGIVGSPYAIQPVIANDNGGTPWRGEDNSPHPPLRVRLAYNEQSLAERGISEGQLVILRFDVEQRVWQQVEEVGRSRALNWLAARPLPFGGRSQIYVLGYVQDTADMPLIAQ